MNIKTHIGYMRATVAALVFAICTLGGCSSSLHEPTLQELAPDAGPPVAPKATIHCDTAYTAEERKELFAAADIWHAQTDGLATITLVFDVDFGSTVDLEGHVGRGENIMLRLESWMDLVKSEDDAQGGLLLGVVSPAGGIHNPWQKPLTVGFVADRLGPNSISDATLKQVALHEFGHILGVGHIHTMNAIMFPAAVPAKDVCLKPADLNGFCQVNVCGTHKMTPCE